MVARNTKPLPGFLENETYGDMLAAFLDDAATQLEGTGSALSASNVRGARRAAREIREYHGLDPVDTSVVTNYDGREIRRDEVRSAMEQRDYLPVQ